MTAEGPASRGLTYAARVGDVEVGFTDARLDVAESAPTRDADLAAAVGAIAPGARTVRMHQVHGAEVAIVGGAGADPEAGAIDGVDALVTAEESIALVVRAADCVPVVLADAEAGVIGVAHAGRPGVVAGVVPATLAAMGRLGARQVRAWVGPAVCGGCYEVPARMRDEVAAAVPETRAETTWGTPAVDVVAGVLAQLTAAGVVEIDRIDRCTREDLALHSYRRDQAAAGRMAGIVARVPARPRTEQR